MFAFVSASTAMLSVYSIGSYSMLLHIYIIRGPHTFYSFFMFLFYLSDLGILQVMQDKWVSHLLIQVMIALLNVLFLFTLSIALLKKKNSLHSRSMCLILSISFSATFC
jgi:hypothetical protein